MKCGAKEKEMGQIKINQYGTSLGGAVVKNLPANAGTRVRSLVREDPICHGAARSVRHSY